MCEFVSWVEKNKKVYFLTGDQVFNSERGKALRGWCKSSDDYCGHGAIRWFYELEDGENKEYTDFSTPKNFPTAIAKAIKSGAMRGLGAPVGLLTQPARAEYDRVVQPAWAEYNRVVQPARAEYNRVTQPAWAEYNRVVQTAWAEYNRVVQPAWAKYNRVTQLAYAEYKRVKQLAHAEYERVKQLAHAEYERVAQDAFWDLFAVPENRVEAWR